MHVAAVLLLLEVSALTHKNGSTGGTLVTVRFLLLAVISRSATVGIKSHYSNFRIECTSMQARKRSPNTPVRAANNMDVPTRSKEQDSKNENIKTPV